MQRTASKGTVQSPVCLVQGRARIVDDAAPLHYVGHWDGLGRATLSNNGQSAVVSFENPASSPSNPHLPPPFPAKLTLSERPFRPFLVGGPLGSAYLFEQLHFHWGPDDAVGSEHLLDGRAHSMEAHLVHYNARYGSFGAALAHPDGLAVVALWLDGGGSAVWRPLQPIVRALRHIRRPGTRTTALPADCLRWLAAGLELGRHYYTYDGSMTTAPYRECVRWLIYRTPVYVSPRQTAAFRRLLRRCPARPGGDRFAPITSNFRPVQRSAAGGDPLGLVFVRDSVGAARRAKL
ncbi:carbonic anhydrase [Anopheles gambiae]|uniref:carbonic anhydrase n=1 Tax=Anopheles gambiae TaxID=7165 RepID=UPI002AC8E25E|nr:carbonic anhydrase [Anopheles gambiae]